MGPALLCVYVKLGREVSVSENEPVGVEFEALIQLRPEGREGLRRAVGIVEGMGGRVMFSFPPHTIVASLPGEGIDELRTEPGILSVDTTEIAEERLKEAPEAIRMVMAAWNEHLAKQHTREEPPAIGLRWDAPDRLAPDPPAEVQEMLQRRESNMRSVAGDETSR